MRIICVAVAIVLLSACDRQVFSETELNAGGNSTSSTIQGTLIKPAPSLSPQQQLSFYTGRSFAVNPWVFAPASTTARDGLGPLFNARSCSACHINGGRGRLPDSQSDPAEPLVSSLVRISVPGEHEHLGIVFDETYGDQIQLQGQGVGVNAVPGEATLNVRYIEHKGRYSDGSSYTLKEPILDFTEWSYGLPSDQLQTSLRTASALLGLGLLEAIAETDILANADEHDINKDGISGKPNRVWDILKKQAVLGRFGWKAGQPTVHQQTAAAFHSDMGLTNSLFPNESCTKKQSACLQAPSGAWRTNGVEVDDNVLSAVTLFTESLPVPAPRQSKSVQIKKGKQLFNKLNCVACHTPRFETSMHANNSYFSDQVIWPYSDLLLHDMGAGLADHRSEYEANGREWRTPPLWGIGLAKFINKRAGFLHDGRADTIEEAILWHGGEAKVSQQQFIQLSKKERLALLAFINAL